MEKVIKMIIFLFITRGDGFIVARPLKAFFLLDQPSTIIVATDNLAEA